MQKVISIADTKKGPRIWIQGTTAMGWNGGDRYNIELGDGWIKLEKATDGARAVTAAKGGIIDLTGKKYQGICDGHHRINLDASAEIIVLYI